MGITKAASARAQRRVVSIHDDAIDKSQSDLKAYGGDPETGKRGDYNIRHITLLEEPDEPAVWFTLRPIEKAEGEALAVETLIATTDSQYLKTLHQEAFRVACMRIENLRANEVDDDGVLTGEVVNVPWRTHEPPGKSKRMVDAVYRAVPERIRIELGAMVLDWGAFTLSKNSSAGDSSSSSKGSVSSAPAATVSPTSGNA